MKQCLLLVIDFIVLERIFTFLGQKPKWINSLSGSLRLKPHTNSLWTAYFRIILYNNHRCTDLFNFISIFSHILVIPVNFTHDNCIYLWAAAEESEVIFISVTSKLSRRQVSNCDKFLEFVIAFHTAVKCKPSSRLSAAQRGRASLQTSWLAFLCLCTEGDAFTAY